MLKIKYILKKLKKISFSSITLYYVIQVCKAWFCGTPPVSQEQREGKESQKRKAAEQSACKAETIAQYRLGCLIAKEHIHTNIKLPINGLPIDLHTLSSFLWEKFRQ